MSDETGPGDCPTNHRPATPGLGTGDPGLEARIPRIALYVLFPVPQDLSAEAYRSGKKLKARDVMTKRVITAPEDMSAHELADVMVMRHINRVPIVAEGRLVGIVTRGDLVRALAERKT